MPRKKKREEELDERWMLPYSDMMTLSLSLFIVMFGAVAAGGDQYDQLSEHLGDYFGASTGGDSILGNIVNLGQTSTGAGTGEGNGAADSERTISSETAKEAQLSQKLEDQKMSETRENIKTAFEDANLADDVEVSLRSNGIYISLQDSILFDAWSDELTSTVEKYLDVVSNEIKDLDKDIVVAGHTADFPSATVSGWELSANRAISVMDYLVDQEGVNPDRISIQAFAEKQPIDSEQTEEAFSRNRRVEIIVNKDYE